MSITVACGQCRHTMRVSEEHAGRKVRCKGCGQAVRVPAAETLEELDDLPEPPARNVPLPPPLPPASARTAASGKPAAGMMDKAQAWLKDAQTKAPWLKDRRVQIGLAGGAGLFLLILVFSLFSMMGGSKADSGVPDSGSGAGGGSASADGGSAKGDNGGKPGNPPEVKKPQPPPEAGEAAGVLPPPPPPFKHAALAQRAAAGGVKERNDAIVQLGQKGAEAKPAARALCEAILEKETCESALLALEKVHPALFPHVRTLVVDNNAWNHQQASQAIAGMKEEGSAAVPVIFGHITYVTTKVDDKHPFYNNMEQLIGEDLTTLSLIAPGERGTARLLIDMVKYKLPSGKPGITVRQHAIDGLGRIAFQYPESRNEIVLTIIPALVDANLQKNALAASAQCSTASEPLKEVLQKLKLNSDASVRTAADAALAEIESRVTFVPQLAKAGLVEGLVPHPLFEWAYGIVSGKTPTATAVPDLTKHDKAELYVLYTCLCLCRLPDSPGRPQAEVRKMALEQVIPFAQKEARLRKYIAPVLIEAMEDPAIRPRAREGLLLCGLDAVRLLKAARGETARKMFAELEGTIRDRCEKTVGVDQQTALHMLGELDSISISTELVLLQVIRQSLNQDQLLENSRLAAKLFVRFGVKDLKRATDIYQLVANKWTTDTETIKLLQEACAAVKIKIDSDFAFHASVVQHPEAPTEMKHPSAEWFWKNPAQMRASQDAEFKKAFREVLTAMALGETRDDGKNPQRRYRLSERREMAIFLAFEFGPEARPVAPVFIQWLTKLAQGEMREEITHLDQAVLALEKLGPDTPEAKETLRLLLSADLTRKLGQSGVNNLRTSCKRILTKWQALPP